MKVFGTNSKNQPPSPKQIICCSEYLKKHGIDENSFIVRDIREAKTQFSHEDFFARHGVDRTPWSLAEARTAEARHRILARTVVLWTLVIPMSIVPFWLMLLLSLPVFNIKPFSERVQAGFFVALVSDYIGLYYVITRDLFPRGNKSREKKNDEDEDS